LVAFGAKTGFLMTDGLNFEARHARHDLCLRWLPLITLLGLASAHAAVPQPKLLSATVASVEPRVAFAIADFDGDHRPDVASVEPGANGALPTQYQIQLRLSASGRRFIHLNAPPGGLWIEARDVNHDGAVDLVVVTAWRRQPVAVLLNNGHGSFSRIEPARCPGTFRRSSAGFSAAPGHPRGALGLAPESRGGISLQVVTLPGPAAPLEPIRTLPANFRPIGPFLISQAVRAPPFPNTNL
jgi:hypothetical protein